MEELIAEKLIAKKRGELNAKVMMMVRGGSES